MRQTRDEEEIEGYQIVINSLRDGLNMAEQKIHRLAAQITFLTKERNEYRDKVRLMEKAVSVSDNEARLFKERNRRSWK